ncbi:MAG: hypothetical protein K6C68_02945 [Ruminococcus sp.]|nr:hypothetical protein [Ruminococcus sp.]
MYPISGKNAGNSIQYRRGGDAAVTDNTVAAPISCILKTAGTKADAAEREQYGTDTFFAQNN